MSLALWGGLAGAGRGISDVGRQMELDAMEARRQQNLADIAAARDQSREDIAALRAGRAGSGSRSSSGGGGTGGGASLRELIDDPEVMAFVAAKDREKVDDARAMAKGQKLTREVEGAQPMDEEGNVMEGPGAPKTVDKYEPGTAQKVREEGRDALWEAMKLSRPGQADDLSKAQRTDQGTKLAADYAKGDDRAGEAALINDSKPAFDDGSSNATGKVTSGSLADARAKERLADAGADKALAAKRAAGGGGGKGGKLTGDDETDRKILDGRSKTAGRDLVAADRALKLATENGDKEGAASARAAQDAARANLDEVKAGERALEARREAKRTGTTPAAKTEAKEVALPAAELAKAKAAIARNPANRDEVIRRAKAAGYSTAGL